jgi:hypothetical protein
VVAWGIGGQGVGGTHLHWERADLMVASHGLEIFEVGNAHHDVISSEDNSSGAQ